MTNEELKLLTDLRWALGDNGKRMQPELVEYAKAMRDVLQGIADACAEVSDLTPQAYRDKVLRLGARARVLLGPNVGIEPPERSARMTG